MWTFIKDVFSFVTISAAVYVVGICLAIGVLFIGCHLLEGSYNMISEEMGRPVRIK